MLHHPNQLIDFAHWPPALPHVSKRSLSKKVIIRNASNWIELSTVGMLSGPYIIGFIICTVRRRDPVKDKLMWLCLSRWLSLLVEAAWAAASLAYWDLHRTVDWTDRLYGTTKRTRLQHLTHLVQYPAFLARLPPLAAASAFLALYKSSREPWMKVFAIILFSEVGLSLAFTFLVLSSMLLTISHGWFQPMTATFFADLPGTVGPLPASRRFETDA